MNRIDKTFKKKQKLLSIYFSAGHPELQDTLPIIPGFTRQWSGYGRDRFTL